MNKLRKWIIYKLGGFTIEDIQFKDVVDGYWDKVHIDHSLYILEHDYTKKNAESIEQELATQIGMELLRRDCIFFCSPVKDRDDLYIRANCITLKLHKRESYHMPNHLVFKEEQNNDLQREIDEGASK